MVPQNTMSALAIQHLLIEEPMDNIGVCDVGEGGQGRRNKIDGWLLFRAWQ